MNELFFDIETRPTLDSALIKRISAGVKPPGQYKKPDSIAKWWAEEGALAVNEALQRTALDGTYGRLAAFGWAKNDEPVKCVYGDDERGMLEAAVTYFERQITLVAFNGEFDLRFLFQRMVINHVPVPYWLRDALEKRYDGWVDPMKQWAGFRGYIKQADLEAALGIPREFDKITGADVADSIATGDWGAVELHCITDVENLRAIYRRLG
jgi:hypothetical protein